MLSVFPEEVQPEPPVSVLMDAEDTLLSPAHPEGPPPGSLQQYRIFSVDVTGRRSATPTLGSIVRLEKRVPPPPPVGPTIPAPPGVQRPAGVTARVLQSLDTHLTPSDRTLLGASTNASSSSGRGRTRSAGGMPLAVPLLCIYWFQFAVFVR